MNREQQSEANRLASISMRWNALAWQLAGAYEEQREGLYNWRLRGDEVRRVMSQAAWSNYRHQRFVWEQYAGNRAWENRAAADGKVPVKMPLRPTVDQPPDEAEPSADAAAAFREFLGNDRIERAA